jgi:outer membrane immunogenic protein
MSRIQFLGASLIAIAAATAANAADLGGYEPPPVANYNAPSGVYGWGGAYIGLQGGYAWNHVDDGNLAFTANGFMGGLYAGYNVQAASNFVVGVEADGNLKSASGNNGTTWYSNPWDASLRLRAGFAFGNFMVYGAGGGTVGRINVNDGSVSDSQTKIGWNAAAGVEAMLTNNITGRVEFRHTNLGSSTYDLTVPTTVSSSSNAVLVGVGMKF